MRTIKRILAVLVSLTMVFGTLTVTALADEEVYDIETLSDLTTAFAAGHTATTATYRLTEDITNGLQKEGGAPLKIVADDDITLDLNGHSITIAANKVAFDVAAGGTFTIIDNGETKGFIKGYMGSASYQNHLFTVSGSLILDGVTLKDGRNSHSISSTTSYTYRGACIWGKSGHYIEIKGGSVISNFTANGKFTGTTGVTGLGSGAAVYSHAGTLVMNNATIENCTANSGTVNSSATGGQGGAIFLTNGTTATLTNVTIRNNTARQGGGIYVNSTNTLTMTGCTISGNTASNQAGGLFANGTIDVINSVLDGNTGNYGGNIRINSGTTTFTNGEIKDGEGTGSSSSGSNLYVNGGEAVINGTTISGTPSYNPEFTVYTKSAGTITVNSGTVSSDIMNEGNVTVNNGVIGGTVASNSYTAGTVTVNGGWFAAAQPQENVSTLGTGLSATGICADAPNPAVPYTVTEDETYTVSFTDNGSTAAADITGNHGAAITIPDYTPASGTFGGWYYDAELTQAAPAPGDEVEFSDDITLYAWVAMETLYAVTVNIDGTEATELSGNYVAGGTFTLPEGPVVPHFTFEGYSLTEGGSVDYLAGDEYTVTEAGTIDFYTVYTEHTIIATITAGGTTTKYYDGADLADAVQDLTTDATITLQNSFTTSSRINTKGERVAAALTNVTFDLNGNTITYTGSARGIINARAYCYITIIDSVGTGGLVSQSTYSSNNKSLVYANSNSRITIEAGTFTGNYEEISNSTALVTVSGGWYTLDPAAYIKSGTLESYQDEITELWSVRELEEVPVRATLAIEGGETTEYASYLEALQAAQALEDAVTATLTLCEDQEADSSLNIGFTNPDLNLTIDYDGHSVTRANRTRCFSFAAGTFTLKDGSFDATGLTYTAGDGSFAKVSGGATVTLSGMNFSNFTAGTDTSNGTTSYRKGFMAIDGASTVTVDSCSFTDIHSAGNGGVFYLKGSSLNLVDSTFTGTYSTYTNSDYAGGGVVYTDRDGDICPSLDVDGCTFTGCYAVKNAGLFYLRACNATITDCTITGRGNAESKDAAIGGVAVIERNGGITSNLTVTGTTTISGFNTTDGGAFCVSGGTTLTVNSGVTISDCTATRGGAVVIFSNSSKSYTTVSFNGTITNCVSTGTVNEEVKAQPVWSAGFFYLNGTLTTTGATVYQYESAAVENTVSGAIGADVAIRFNYGVALVDGATPTLSYNANGTTATADGTLQPDGTYTFEVTGINVYRIADDIAPLVKDGEATISLARTYSVLDYFQALNADENATPALQTLLANTISYASLLQAYAEAGTAIDLSAEALAWVGTAKTEAAPATTAPARVITASADENNKIVSAFVNVADKATLGFKYAAEEGAVITVKCADETVATQTVETTVTEGVIYLDRISPADYDTAFTVEISSGGTTLSKVSYSVNAYCVRKAAGEDAAVAALVTAIYNYGTAAAEYVA